jgi:hypothetical protein
MSDAFTDAMVILAAAADAAGCKARLTELKKQMAVVETAEAQLASDRAAHEAAVKVRKSELDKRQARLTEGEVELNLRRRALADSEARREAGFSSAQDYPVDPNFGPGTQHPCGLTRGPE